MVDFQTRIIKQKEYDIEDFNNRIEAIKNEKGITYKELAKELGISERYFRKLRNQPQKYKSIKINNNVIELWEKTFPYTYVTALVHKFSKKSQLDWVEIVSKTFRSYKKAELEYSILESQYNPLNSAELLDSAIGDNPVKIAGRLRYWLNHHDVNNERETEEFISELEEHNRLYS